MRTYKTYRPQKKTKGPKTTVPKRESSTQWWKCHYDPTPAEEGDSKWSAISGGVSDQDERSSGKVWHGWCAGGARVSVERDVR